MLHPQHRIGRSVLVATLGLAAATVCLGCPEHDRLRIGDDGQSSQTGGAVPFGSRAADDLFVPAGNGNNYHVRVIKAVMISNFVLSPTNVGITIYADGVSPTSPPRPQPGSIVSGSPNVAPTVRDLGPFDLTPGYRAYEISYAIPSGFVQLAPGAWYWLSPYAVAAVPGEAAYAAVSGDSPIIGEVINRSFGSPSMPDTYTTWDLTTDCCLGPHDLAMYIDAVQIGRSVADINCSVTVTVQDLFDFLGAYFSGAPEGDFNGAGGFGVQDIFDYLAAYFAA